MELISVILFAVALSFDGFGVGISYGMRKIKIPPLSLIVVSLTSSTAIGLSMLSGHFISKFISVRAAELIGAGILIIIGIWILFQTYSVKKNCGLCDSEKNVSLSPEPILRLRIKSLGLVIQILREPASADVDNSGIISLRESVLLGLALAMDALGAGLGAAMAGFKPFITPFIVGIVKFLFVSLGDYVGRRYTASWLGDKAAVLPGWVLICLGLTRVIKI